MSRTDYNAVNFNMDRDVNNAIKRIATIVVAILFVLGCTFVPGSVIVEEGHATQKDAGYVKGEVIVCYVDTDDMNLTARQEKKVDNLLGDSEELMEVEEVCIDDVDVSNSKLDKEIQKDQVVDETLAVVSSDGKTTEELIKEIEKLPNVDFVEPNYIVKVTEGDNAGDFTSRQWAYYNGEGASDYRLQIKDWNNPEAEENAKGTVVAVLDTGVDYNHPDLDDVMWTDGEDYPALTALGGGRYGINTATDNSRDPMDKFGHGSHCAGIIAAEWGNEGVSGAANGTKIMAVRASKLQGSLSYTDVIEGFNYIKTAKDCGVNVVAINCSWNNKVTSAESINLAVMQAGEKGIVSVFASGNGGKNTDYRYCRWENGVKVYSEYLGWFLKDNPYKIVVNSILSDGSLAEYSNFGAKTTDMAAPGTMIASTVIHSSKQSNEINYYTSNYQYKDGTSMAAPAVSGEVAIVAADSEFRDCSADVIASVVKQNAQNNVSLAGKCKSGGQANVGEALNADLHDLKYRNFRIENTELTYTGSVVTPTVVDIAGKLHEGSNGQFEVSCQESVDVGEYRAEVSGKNGYQYSDGQPLSLSYRIVKASPQVSLRSGGYIYDGGVKSNAVTVKGADGATWTNGNQYKLSGTLSAKMPGTYSVTVTPTDTSNYNAVSKSFSISVQPTTIKSLSGAKKAFKVKAAKKGKNYVTGYQVRYSLNESMSGAKTKTIGTKYSRVSKKVTKLKAKKTYYVQVRSYKTISKKKYYSSWSAVKSVKTK